MARNGQRGSVHANRLVRRPHREDLDVVWRDGRIRCVAPGIELHQNATPGTEGETARPTTLIVSGRLDAQLWESSAVAGAHVADLAPRPGFQQVAGIVRAGPYKAA